MTSERENGAIWLRRATPDDAERLFAWRSEPSARRYQPLRRRSVADLRTQLAERAARPLNATHDGKVQWIVETVEDAVGWLTLTVISREHGIGAIGYTIGERFRGRRYAMGAIQALLPLAFSPSGLDLWRLEAVATIDNVASRKTLERCGFCHEGIARAYLMIGAQRVDHVRYALLRPEWERGNLLGVQTAT